ncbi:uncharacterized protein LOC111087936 [Limulus polyphemus]|uniref:Uncharacterized protein LOC111087936 n=1 Tax=Limulus polyphemus TaxID=6850 RepID=A0ABM1T8A9_LIMPO|nr:uncharacterized protein LOC111087936 [Limulus polyphemus]
MGDCRDYQPPKKKPKDCHDGFQRKKNRDRWMSHISSRTLVEESVTSKPQERIKDLCDRLQGQKVPNDFSKLIMQKKQLGQRAASSDQFSESSRSLFSVMNLPPRFMQHSLKANTRDDGEFSMWGESGGRWDKITFEDCNTASWLSSGESQIEHSVEKVIHPSSTSRSVISSSSYSGVQGTFTNLASPEGSLPNCNAHHGIKDPTSSSLPDSHLSGSSMKVGCTEVDIGNSSHNAQYVEDYPTSELGAAKNDNYEQYDTKLNPIGAKSSEKISDYHPIVFSGQIQQIPYQDMQPDLHKTDSADITNRSLTSSMSYPVKELATTKVELDISASDHCGVSSDNSEMNRLMSFSRGSYNLGLSLGCDEDRSFRKSQEEIRNISNSLNGLHIPPNSTHMTPSVSVAPNSHVEMNFRNTGEGIYNSSDKSKQISNLHESGRGSESSNESYEGLIGAVGGSDMPINKSVFEKKKSGWVGPPPRLGLLGGGESSLNNGTSAWGTPHPPAGSGASSWNGNGRIKAFSGTVTKYN